LVVDVFKPYRIGNLDLKNRFIVAAAADNLTGANGSVTEEHIRRLAELAEGGAGLVITGGVSIMEEGRSGPDTPNLFHDGAVDDYARLTERVHEAGGKVAVQLVHSGIWTSRHQNAMGREGIGASLVPGNEGYVAKALHGPAGKYHAASREEVDAVVAAFAEGAARGSGAGFDAIEVHGAHDSLLAQFLSPITNRRSDEWGGALENRLRLHIEVAKAVRRRIGDSMPLLLKLGIEDGAEGGLTMREGLEAGARLSCEGYTAIEVSQGLMGGDLSQTVFRPIPRGGDGYFRKAARELKKVVSVPLVLTGGLRSLDAIKDVVTSGDADMVGLCRPFIREPALIRRWERGGDDVTECVSCIKCVMALADGPLGCQLMARGRVEGSSAFAGR
jgi:2,4-dienoyl-CoA reductase-like NADH-dependent reductase (Old Yellow Enzyme family)